MVDAEDGTEQQRQESEAAAAAAAEEDLRNDDQGNRFPFARGGPIFIPNFISPLFSVPEFQAEALRHLKGLESELLSAVAGGVEEELSVEDLKVLTEEELVEKALKGEDIEDVPRIDDPAQLLEYNDAWAADISLSGNEIILSSSSLLESNNLELPVTMIGSCDVICQTDDSEMKLPKERGRKRGRRFDRECRAAELEGQYFEKVKQYALIKQKQDEDKLAARLHSFSGSSRSMEASSLVPDKIERMRSLRFVTCPVKARSAKPKEHIQVNFPEVILCMEIYHKKNTSKKIQEFLVLGSQTLTELRDCIYCLTDRLMEAAYDHSGYFLIEDTFYNDLRNPIAMDYSKPILDWLKNCHEEAKEKWEYIMAGVVNKKHKEFLKYLEGSSVPNLRAVDMHKTRFSDLQFKLGAGYLYCHQGGCKHIMVIRDMRLIHAEDVQNRAEYPLLTFQLRPRYRKCSVCDIYHAVKMTVDDKWAPRNPCYFCLNCYFLLHYKEDNSLLYSHIVFDYFQE